MPTDATQPGSGTAPAGRRLDFTIPSVLTRGREVQDAVLQACRDEGFGDDAYFAVKLALDEAVTNAIKHGNGLDASKTVRVHAEVTADRLYVEVGDEGPGFDPNKVPDPTLDENLGKCSGRGLLLIEAYMSDVSWSPDGRTIQMTKFNRSERPAVAKAG